jgi:DNA-binding MarR family transcriptional regulator
MKDNIKETQDNILNYLYENKDASPQSQTKIRLALNLSDSKEHMRTLKTALDDLIKKNFIKKQADRGNYKIEVKGIEHIEEN